MTKYIIDENSLPAEIGWLKRGVVSLRDLKAGKVADWLSDVNRPWAGAVILLSDSVKDEKIGEEAKPVVFFEKYAGIKLWRKYLSMVQVNWDRFVLRQGDEVLIIHHDFGGGCTLLTKTK